MFMRHLILACLLVALPFLTGCPVKGSAFEPKFPETASSSIGPASP